MKVTIDEIVRALHEVGGILLTCKYTVLANRIEAHGIEQPSIDALIDVLADTPFKKTLGDSNWQATFSDHQLDTINNAIRARGQK